MSTQNEWKHAYGRQRELVGRALYVSRNRAVTEALRIVMPPVARVQHSQMISGRPASCLLVYPPVESAWSQLCRVRKVR